MTTRPPISDRLKSATDAVVRPAWIALRRSDQPLLWGLALILGAVSGEAAILFNIAIAQLQVLLFGATDETLASAASGLHWARVIGAPVLGGLIVGLILHWFSNDGRAHSVPQVIEASRLRGGRIDLRCGIVAATVSVISLGFGASSGREGPVVHMGATIASVLSRWLNAPPTRSRTLMGCAVAAAVSASFNAPIAGSLFALEVVLGHYAVRAFAPIVIASVAGVVVARLHVGDFPVFRIPPHELATFWELPAFALLGLLCAGVATVFMGLIIAADSLTDQLRERWNYPVWAEPAMGGLCLGILFLFVPQTIGVGYETTSLVLYEAYGLWTLIGVTIAKMAAVALTLATRFGGGVFSPSLMLGALTGGAFGIVATAIFPDVSGSYGLYALAGMGAVAAAMLGAPISTSLIVFELTGDYRTAVAVMVSVSVSVVMTQHMIERSYFHWRLARRGLHLGDGPQRYLIETLRAGPIMRQRGAEDAGSETQAWSLIENGVFVTTETTLAVLLPMFDRLKHPFVPVVEHTEGGGKTLIGAVFHVDALRAYNRALVQAHEEEHS